jgi:hypothetical protein
MRGLIWFMLIAAAAGVGWALARWRKQWVARQQAAEARLASFIAQAAPPVPTALPAAAPAVPPAAPPAAPQERLLLDAATKAGEAGEPALAIQLYAKLISRYPRTQFAAQARAAVETQKKKLAQG